MESASYQHTVSLPSTLSSFPYRSFPPELSPSYFPRFSSVHPVVIPVPLLPTGAPPKLFLKVSLPSTLSSLPYHPFPSELSPGDFSRFPPRSLPSRSFPTELSPCYFLWFPLRPPNRRFHPSLPAELSPSYFPRFPLRPPFRQIRIAPSRQA